MFKKTFRSKLIKHGWLDAAKEGGNESQSWKRTKDNVKIAISDMILLYENLPLDKREQLFNLQNYKGLFDILLSYEKPTDLVSLELANYLVNSSIFRFKMLYDYQNKNTPVLTSVINENLQKAVGICNDIIYREKLNNFNIKIPTEEYVYLCSWNEVIDREKDNLVTFLNEVMDVYIEKVQLTMSQNKTVISGKCINDYTGIIFDLRLILNYTRDRADLIVYDKNGFEAKQQLTVKSNNNDYLLYFGKSEIKILKEKGITLDWWHF